MPEFEQSVCRYCGSTFNGRRIVRLDKSRFQHWHDLDRERTRVRKADVSRFMLSSLLGSSVVMGLPVLIVTMTNVLWAPLPDWTNATLFVVTAVTLGYIGWILYARWLVPRTLGEKSREIPLEREQEQMLTSAGYNLEELKRHRHGYVVEEK